MRSAEFVNGLVLAGGSSSRMGQDKGLLCLGGRPLVEIAVRLVSQVCRRVFLLAPADRYPFLDLTRIPDRFNNGGPLAALLAGLEQSDTDFNVVVPCDMPFLTVDVLGKIMGLSDGADAVVPCDEQGRWFPLSAGYRRSCLPAIEACVAAGNLQASSFLPAVSVRVLATRDFPEGTFANINTREDLLRWAPPDSGGFNR